MYTMTVSVGLSDEKIVENTRTGNKELFAVLVRRHQDALVRYARYLVHDEHKAHDVVQESFIKAYMNLNGFDTRKKFSSWIYRIVHNEAMNMVKKYRKEYPLVDAQELVSGEDLLGDLGRKETVRMVHTCLNDLPILYREPLVLFYLEEKSYEEISDIVRIPMGTVATRVNRARGMMKIVCKNKN